MYVLFIYGGKKEGRGKGVLEGLASSAGLGLCVVDPVLEALSMVVVIIYTFF